MFRPALVLPLAFAAIASVHAQNAPNPVQLPEAVPPAVPAVPATPPAPAAAQQTPQIVPPAPPVQPGQGSVRLNSSDAKELLTIYSQLTGFRLIFENVPLAPVPLFIDEYVPNEEAIEIIKIALMMNGVALVPTDDPKIWKVFGGASNPKQAAIPLYTDIDLVPEGERLVSFLFKLKYADVSELAGVLPTIFAPAKALGGAPSMVPLPKSGAILVTENTPTIRQLYRFLNQIDTPPAEVDHKFFKLQRADAKDVQEKLENILTKQQQGQTTTTTSVTTPVGQPAVRRLLTTPEGLPLPEGTPPEEAATTVEIAPSGPNEENLLQGKVKITADIRTNRILIVARPGKDMEFISELIEEFDAIVAFGEPETRTLKFVTAADIFQVLVKVISEPGQDAAAGGAGGTAGARPGQQAGSRTGLTGNLFDNNRNTNTGFGQSGLGGGGGGQTLSESLSAEERDTTPDAVTIGNTKIIANKSINAITVLGNEDVKAKIFQIIDNLDVRPPQVMLHTVIGQLTLDETDVFGVDYILKNAGRFENIGGTDGTGTGGGTTTGTGVIGFNGNTPQLNLSALLNQRTIRQIGTAGAGGLSGFFTAGNALNAIVTALSSTNKFKVVSNPSVAGSNNKKAVISSGSEIPIPQNIQSGFAGGANNGLVTNSTIQFKTVALQLEILPLINSEREVTLDIVVKVDEQNGTTLIDGNAIPRIATRVLKTTVSVPNEATLALGGLIKQSKTDARSGIPILSKIPLIGGLFRTTTKSDMREELVILIRPEVTVGPAEAVAVREKMQESFNLESDLESTIIPKGVRVHAPAEELMRKPAPPGLREYSGRPAFNVR